MARTPRNLLALALYDRRVVAAELRGRSVGEAFTLDVTDGLSFDQPQQLGKALAEAMAKHGVSSRHAVVGLPARWLLTRSVNVPVTNDDTLVDMMRLQADRAFGGGARDMAIDYLPGGEAAGRRGVLIAATLRRRLDQINAMAAAAGLSVVRVTSTAACLAGHVAASSPSRTSTELMLHVTAYDTEASLVGATGVTAIRHLATSSSVGATGRPDAGTLSDELDRTMTAEMAADPPRRVVVWGDSGLSDANLNTLRDRLSVDAVVRGDPASLASLNGVAPEANRYVDAIAVARAALGDADEMIDVLHPRLAVKPKRWAGKKKRVGAIAIAGVAAIVVAMFVQHQLATQRVADLNQQLARLKPDVDDARALVDRVRHAEGWYRSRPRALECLLALTNAFPDGSKIWATDLTFRDDHTGLVTGRCTDERTVLEVLDRIKSAQGFSKANLVYLREAGRGSDAGVAFAIAFEFDEKQPTTTKTPAAVKTPQAKTR
ncbi:MAG: hypothetical protein GC159_02115 [Phycisphaera sp.]|nr:hypothetical protein [Phycisphaera sp.]